MHDNIYAIFSCATYQGRSPVGFAYTLEEAEQLIQEFVCKANDFRAEMGSAARWVELDDVWRFCYYDGQSNWAPSDQYLDLQIYPIGELIRQ